MTSIYGTESFEKATAAWRAASRPKNSKPLKSIQFVDIFYDYVKPDFVTAKWLGLLPLTRENDGTYEWKIFSVSMLHSITIYALMTYLVTVIFEHLIDEIRKTREGRLYIYSIYLFLNLLPVIMVAETFKIGRYFNSWQQYQVLYIKVLNRPMDFKFKRIRTISFLVKAVFALLFLTLVIERFHENRVAYCIFFGYYYWAIATLSSVWYISIYFLYKTADTIEQDIKAIADSKSNVAIADMEILWVDLCRLSKSLGRNFCFSLSYHLLFLFLEVIVTTYEALMVSLTLKVDPILASSTVLLMLYLSSIPFTAEIATKKIGENFYKFLMDLKIKKDTRKHEKDIDLLLQTVQENPPAIDLGGFVVLDNGVITSLMSTMVTYLIVLLQFKV